MLPAIRLLEIIIGGLMLGLVTTAGRVFHIGALICANRYVYSLSNEAALTGTLQAGGPVVKIF